MNAFLNAAALVVIFLLVIAVASAIVVLGSLPGKIARKRGHPHPDAVNVASWIGLAMGVFWPLAFIWAFLPVPSRGNQAPVDNTELKKLRQRIEALEAATAELDSGKDGDAS